MTKTWDPKDAEQRICNIIMDELPEDILPDDECRKLAKKIVNMLENEEDIEP